jgi:cytidine deaminase
MQVLLGLAELTLAERELVDRARLAAARAYCRYSGYAVGAAMVGESGRIYAGCNVENASYGATMCAERSAIFSLVSAGERQITKICVYAPGEPLAMPCGMCRQVIAEFCLDAPVLVAGPMGALRRSFAELLPEAFRFAPEGKP